jgi:hypothetical protein
VFFNEKAAARFHQQAAASLTIELYPAMRCTIRKHCLLLLGVGSQAKWRRRLMRDLRSAAPIG